MKYNNYGVCCYFFSFNDFREVVGISYMGIAVPFPLSGEGGEVLYRWGESMVICAVVC